MGGQEEYEVGTVVRVFMAVECKEAVFRMERMLNPPCPLHGQTPGSSMINTLKRQMKRLHVNVKKNSSGIRKSSGNVERVNSSRFVLQKVEKTLNEFKRIHLVRGKLCKHTEWGESQVGAGCC
jgi:hypothetical protein